MSTKTEQMIKSEMAEIERRNKNIEHLREVQYTQEVIDVFSDKKTSEEQRANVCKAYFDNYMRKVRIANMEKARANKKPKGDKKAPTDNPAQPVAPVASAV